MVVVFVSSPWEDDCVALSFSSLSLSFPSLFCGVLGFPRLTPWLPLPGTERLGCARRAGRREGFPPGAGLETQRARGAGGPGAAPRLSLSDGYLFSFLVVIAGPQALPTPSPGRSHFPDWSHRKLGDSGLPFLWQPRRAASALGAVAGSAAPRGVERPLWTWVLNLCAAEMASSEQTRCVSRELWCLGIYSGFAFASLVEGPQWALGMGPETRVCGPKGV